MEEQRPLDPLGSQTTRETPAQPSNPGFAQLGFESNRGQAPTSVKFLSRGKDCSILLGENLVSFLLPIQSQKSGESGGKLARLEMRYWGANAHPMVFGEQTLAAKSHLSFGQ
jgi:hypothetical protein